MKRKMSMAFLLLAAVALLSLSNVFNILRSLPGLFSAFSAQSVLSFLNGAIITLTPLALVALLVVNSKRDIKQIAYIVTLICGIAHLLSRLLRIQADITLLSTSELFIMLSHLSTVVTKLVTGVLLIMGAVCIKNEKANKAMVVITTITFYLLLIPTGAGLITGQMKLLAAVTPLLTVAGVCLFPRAIFDHEHCVTATGTPLKIAIGIAVVFAFVLLVSGGITSGGGGSSGRTCAKAGCNNRAVTSGDSVYCSAHSNRCGNCGCYIDGDAMFCMDCIRGAIK